MPNELKCNPMRRTSLDDIKVIEIINKPTPKEIKKARRFYEIASKEYKDDQFTDALFNIQKSINQLKKKVGDLPNAYLKKHSNEAYDHIKDCYILSSCCHLGNKDYDFAIEKLEKVISVEEENVEALWLRANVYSEKKDPHSLFMAYKDLELAHKIAPNKKKLF